MPDIPTHELNLLGVACPMNFVKTKLFMDKMHAGEVVKVFLDPGEPVESVTTSIRQEGHDILESIEVRAEATEKDSSSKSLGYYCITIRKV